MRELRHGKRGCAGVKHYVAKLKRHRDRIQLSLVFENVFKILANKVKRKDQKEKHKGVAYAHHVITELTRIAPEDVGKPFKYQKQEGGEGHKSEYRPSLLRKRFRYKDRKRQYSSYAAHEQHYVKLVITNKGHNHSPREKNSDITALRGTSSSGIISLFKVKCNT
jgi:hypothetical protein